MLGVSTHAPARGATTRNESTRAALLRFNSRAREGRDAVLLAVASGASSFQLTRPRGARREYVPIASVRAMFQLTRPRGARQ